MAKNNTKQEYSIIDNPGKGDDGIYTLICNFLLDNLLQYRQGTLTKGDFLENLETFVGQAVSKKNIDRFNQSIIKKAEDAWQALRRQDEKKLYNAIFDRDLTERAIKAKKEQEKLERIAHETPRALLAGSLFTDLTTKIKSQDDLQNLINSYNKFTFVNKELLDTYGEYLANEQKRDLQEIINKFRLNIGSSQEIQNNGSSQEIPNKKETKSETTGYGSCVTFTTGSNIKITVLQIHGQQPVVLIAPTNTKKLTKEEAQNYMAELLQTEVNKALNESNSIYNLSEKQKHLLTKIVLIYGSDTKQLMDFLITNNDPEMLAKSYNKIVDNLAKPAHWWSKQKLLSTNDMEYFNHKANDNHSMLHKNGKWVNIVTAQSSFILNIPRTYGKLLNAVQDIVAMCSNTNLTVSRKLESMSKSLPTPQTLQELDSNIAQIRKILHDFQLQLSTQLDTATDEKDKLGAITKFFCKIIPFNNSYKTWMQLDAINNIQKQLDITLRNLETDVETVKSNISKNINTNTSDLGNHPDSTNQLNSTQQIRNRLGDDESNILPQTNKKLEQIYPIENISNINISSLHL